MSTLWPFRVNWREPFKVSYAFKTEILTSRSGKEQRRALRQSPRKTLEFLTTLAGEDLNRFRRLMVAQQSRLIEAPEVTRRATLASATAIGATSLPLSAAAPAWCIAGVRVVVVAGAAREALTLLGVSGGSTLLLSGPTTLAWNAGARVHPALTGRVAEQIRLGRRTTTLAETEVRFDVDPGSEPWIAPPAATSTFDGREVVDLKINWTDDPEETFMRPAETVDFGQGRIASLLHIQTPGRLRQGEHLAPSAAAAQAVVDLFFRMKGRRGEFYVPSGEPDLTVQANRLLGETNLRVANRDVADTFAADLAHRAVDLRLKDGRRALLKVSSIVVGGGGLFTTLNLAAGLPFAVNAADVLRLSWAPLCRFASDDLTLAWETDSVARTTLSFQQLETLPAESP